MAAPGAPQGWVLPPTPATLANGSPLPVDSLVPYNAGQIQDISGSGLNASNNCFVTTTLGVLDLTETARYNVTVSTEQTLAQQTLAYDDIFDYTLSNTDSVTFLNAFTVSGLHVALPADKPNQQSNGAACSFNINPVSTLLTAVLRDAIDASGNKSSIFLLNNLNKTLANIVSTSFTSSYVATVNTDTAAGISDSNITLSAHLNSGNVTYNATAAMTSINDTCYGSTASNALVNQIDLAHLLAYQRTTGLTNLLNTAAFPALVGDQFVFALRTTQPEIAFSVNNITATTYPAALNATFAGFTSGPALSIKDNQWTVAFRLTLGDGEMSTAGYTAPTSSGTTFSGLTSSV